MFDIFNHFMQACYLLVSSKFSFEKLKQTPKYLKNIIQISVITTLKGACLSSNSRSIHLLKFQ